MKKYPYPYIEICLKFKEGSYFIDISSYNYWTIESDEQMIFRFFVKFEDEEKCFSHSFKNLNEYNIIKNLRKDIVIKRRKIEDYGHFEDGQMSIVNISDQYNEFIAQIEPLFNEETYQYTDIKIEENKKDEEPKSKRAKFGNFLSKMKDKVKDCFNNFFFCN